MRRDLDCEKLSSIEKMAINHVYCIDQDGEKSAFDVPDDFVELLNCNQYYSSIPTEDVELINDIAEVRVICRKKNSIARLINFNRANSRLFHSNQASLSEYPLDCERITKTFR